MLAVYCTCITDWQLLRENLYSFKKIVANEICLLLIKNETQVNSQITATSHHG